jgi:hypothetical protein
VNNTLSCTYDTASANAIAYFLVPPKRFQSVLCKCVIQLTTTFFINNRRIFTREAAHAVHGESHRRGPESA